MYVSFPNLCQIVFSKAVWLQNYSFMYHLHFHRVSEVFEEFSLTLLWIAIVEPIPQNAVPNVSVHGSKLLLKKCIFFQLPYKVIILRAHNGPWAENGFHHILSFSTFTGLFKLQIYYVNYVLIPLYVPDVLLLRCDIFHRLFHLFLSKRKVFT